MTEHVDNPDCAGCACGTLTALGWEIACSRYNWYSFYVPGQRCLGPSVRDVSGIAEQECWRNAQAG
jgi:hypothetical protein